MDPSARDAYIEAQILTATPQKLRLMLIDAALKYARLTQSALRANQREESFQAGGRLRRIVSELIGSINPAESELSKTTLALYLYIFQAATRAQLHGTADPYDEIIHLLEFEQGTWRLVCDKYPHAIAPEQPKTSREISAIGMTAIPSHTACDLGGPLLPSQSSQFSLDA